jgi:hypothetical protein
VSQIAATIVFHDGIVRTGAAAAGCATVTTTAGVRAGAGASTVVIGSAVRQS